MGRRRGGRDSNEPWQVCLYKDRNARGRIGRPWGEKKTMEGRIHVVNGRGLHGNRYGKR